VCNRISLVWSDYELNILMTVDKLIVYVNYLYEYLSTELFNQAYFVLSDIIGCFWCKYYY